VLIQAVVLAMSTLGPVSAAPAQEPLVQQVQFPGRNGWCPRGYDFNYSNGYCYPNGQHAPGLYVRPTPRHYAPEGYYRPHRHRYPPGYYDRY
jgi:hypothetical protein